MRIYSRFSTGIVLVLSGGLIVLFVRVCFVLGLRETERRMGSRPTTTGSLMVAENQLIRQPAQDRVGRLAVFMHMVRLIADCYAGLCFPDPFPYVGRSYRRVYR